MPRPDQLGAIRIAADGSLVADVQDRFGQALEAVEQFLEDTVEPLAEIATELEQHQEQHPDDPVWSMDLEDALPVVARRIPVWRSHARRPQCPTRIRVRSRPRSRARRERRHVARSTSSADSGSDDGPCSPAAASIGVAA
jgi:hypothetical protein